MGPTAWGCEGVKVEPGDFVLADHEGVVVTPARLRQPVLTKAQEKLQGENVVCQELAEGRSPREVLDGYGIL